MLSENIPLDKIIKEKFYKLLNFLTVSVFVVAALVYLIPNINQTIQVGQIDNDQRFYCDAGKVKYPCQAIKMLEGKTGNIFNTYEWGGYLIWKLPKMKVFVDGRMPAWKDDFGRYPYAVFLAILQT